MRKGRMLYVPGDFLEELEQVKRKDKLGTSKAFECILYDFKLGRTIKEKITKKPKDILGFDL